MLNTGCAFSLAHIVLLSSIPSGFRGLGREEADVRNQLRHLELGVEIDVSNTYLAIDRLLLLYLPSTIRPRQESPRLVANSRAPVRASILANDEGHYNHRPRKRNKTRHIDRRSYISQEQFVFTRADFCVA